MTTASDDVGGVISPRSYMAMEPKISDWQKLQRRPENEPLGEASPVADVLGYPHAKTNKESKR